MQYNQWSKAYEVLGDASKGERSSMVYLDGIAVPQAQATVELVQGLNEQDAAMLQALTSRDTSPIQVQLEKIQKSGSGKFMERFYVGYGHKSIADAAFVHLNFRHISLLAAKAIENWGKFAAIELSTRYVSMVNSDVIDIDETCYFADMKQSEVQVEFLKFYRRNRAKVRAHVVAEHPRRDGEKAEDYERACDARTFDILRGFLPAGTLTNMWLTIDFRQVYEMLYWLASHPLLEVRDLADATNTLLYKQFPGSFKETLKRDDWGMAMGRAYAYMSYELGHRIFQDLEGEVGAVRSDFPTYGELVKDLDEDLSYLALRPAFAPLPPMYHQTSLLTWRALTDFAGLRDIQRHRMYTPRLPVLLGTGQLHDWYLDNLPKDVFVEATQLLSKFTPYWSEPHRTRKPNQTADEFLTQMQYAVPIGTVCPVQVQSTLGGMIYTLELRTKEDVHATVRNVYLRLATHFEQAYPDIRITINRNPDPWTVRRGQQTIIERTEEKESLCLFRLSK